MSAACYCGTCHGCRLAREAGEATEQPPEAKSLHELQDALFEYVVCKGDDAYRLHCEIVCQQQALLDALKWVINAASDAATDRRGVMVNMPEALRRVRAAIAKAEGGAA